FFQAEDGIRDPLVTGIQTCALPIFAGGRARGDRENARADRLEPGAGREGAADQLPRTPLQDQRCRTRRRTVVGPLDLVRYPMMKRSLLYPLLASAVLVSALIAADPANAQTPAVDGSARDGNGVVAPDAYRIGPEDLLQISVWKNDEIGRASCRA